MSMPSGWNRMSLLDDEKMIVIIKQLLFLPFDEITFLSNICVGLNRLHRLAESVVQRLVKSFSSEVRHSSVVLNRSANAMVFRRRVFGSTKRSDCWISFNQNEVSRESDNQSELHDSVNKFHLRSSIVSLSSDDEIEFVNRKGRQWLVFYCSSYRTRVFSFSFFFLLHSFSIKQSQSRPILNWSQQRTLASNSN